ncbi:nidogen-like domain-containing protein [Chamaesiphon sp. VAR_69_metabat_338]|uniref:nidogen-like domain-containing protein n=1 Tax=Chamaesiphon sp. VAR_69_metabat_338 TaxID=2964704 RepID=UPI00286D6ADB|nr:nidogen-like domain-containing protein [Chamaesiphon sp. VAR_69_metabat_338]
MTSLAMSMAMTGVASAAAIRTGFSSNTLAANDDLSTGAVALGFTANFFGTNYTQTYVNNNGNITFKNASGSTTQALNTATTPTIAPFFADVDTRGIGNTPVTYGQGLVNGRNAFAANYVNVGYYSQGTDKLNSFQVVLIDRADTGAGNFDIEFNYDKIQWDQGGTARVGYSNGLAGTANILSFELPGSNVNGAFLDGGSNSLATRTINTNGILGRDIFSARNGAVAIASSSTPTASVPEPFTIVGTLMGAGAALRLRKRLKVTNKL